MMKLDPERYECPDHQVDLAELQLRAYVTQVATVLLILAALLARRRRDRHLAGG